MIFCANGSYRCANGETRNANVQTTASILNLLRRKFRRYQIVFDCISMDTIVQFRYLTIKIPIERKSAVFVLLKSLVIFHNI